MSTLSVEQLAMEALALPSNSRADLAHRLIASLDDTHDADVAKLWIDEIRRRNLEIDEKSVECIPAEEVFRQILSRLGR